MQLLLNPQQLADARQALLDPGSDRLIELVFRLNLQRPLEGISDSTLAAAASLGWLDLTTRTLTSVGWLVADPIREYRFWLDRDRKVHGEDEHALLKPERYAGKSVLEPGSGFGCNLLSLSRVKGRFVGLEPVALYRQFTPIFAEREGLPTPEVVDGRGESLPFANEEFDVVLCYSAHQYMDVTVALLEMTRVLRPGGQLQIVGGVLGDFARGYAAAMIRKPRLGKIKHYLLTIANTLTYQMLKRRLWTPAGVSATTAPIYPTRRCMIRWMTAAGLQVRIDLIARFGGETVFVAYKPIHSSE
jgi:SAM-dependent methyltransferase